MTTTTKPAKKATPAAGRRRQMPRKVAAVNGQEPLVADPAPKSTEPGRPSDHNGIPITREELLSNLPSGAPFKISRLHLADGKTASACRDCRFTADTRGLVAQHRNAEHGSRFGKRTPKVSWPKDKYVELVLPPRDENTAAPTDPMAMTLAEILALMPSIAATADLVDQLETERNAAMDDLAQRMRHDRENQHKIDVYEAHTAELIDLRLMVKNFGSYEALKTEVAELRAWKKKMIARLGPLGFNFTEEEQQ